MSLSLKKQMEYIQKAKETTAATGATSTKTKRNKDPKRASTVAATTSTTSTERGNIEERERLMKPQDEPAMTMMMPPANIFAPLVSSLVINETESDFVNEIKQIFKVTLIVLFMKPFILNSINFWRSRNRFLTENFNVPVL